MEQNPLFEQLRSPLESMLSSEISDEGQYSKSQHLRDIQRNQRYWRGEHYAAPVYAGDRLIWRSARDIASAAKDSTAINDYVLNYVLGEGLNLVGLLGRVPNATAVADSDSDISVEAAKDGDRIIKNLWAHWGVEQRQFDLVFNHWLNGTLFGYTPFVVNKERYGVRVVPQFEMREQLVDAEHYECFMCQLASSPQEVMQFGGCPKCGSPLGPESLYPERTEVMPVKVGDRHFINGSVELHLFSALQVTTPYNIRDLDQCPWLLLEYGENASVLMATYPEVVKNLNEFRSGQVTGNIAVETQEQARRARAEASAYRRFEHYWNANEWLYQRVWVTPPMYYAVADKINRANVQGVVDSISAEYPDGVKATYVNGRLVRLENERLTDVWTACKPTVGETLYPQPLCTPMIHSNDLINDGFNISVQTAQKGMSLNIYDSSVLNPKMFKTQRSGVSDWIPAQPDIGTRLREAVFTTQPAQLAPAVVNMMQTARAAAQEIIHITPALTGTDTREKTLGESEMNRNQALLPHNTQWAYIRKFWSDVYTRAIVQFAKHSDGELYFRVNTALPVSTLKIDNIDVLLHGGWHVEVDQSIPLTWGQRRAQIIQMLERGESFIQLFGLNRPNNLKAVYEILGNEDFEIPGMAEHSKVMSDIRELLQQEPIPGPGGEFLPSIPPDDFEMDHAMWVEFFKQWYYTDEAQQAKRDNAAGYLNALARAKAELNIVNMIAASQQPPPEEGGNSPRSKQGAPEPSNQISSPPPSGAEGIGPAEPPPQSPEEMAAIALEGR